MHWQHVSADLGILEFIFILKEILEIYVLSSCPSTNFMKTKFVCRPSFNNLSMSYISLNLLHDLLYIIGIG